MIGAVRRIPGHPLPAGERQPRAAQDPARLWRRAAPDRPARGQRRRHPRGPAAGGRGAGALCLPRPVLEPRELASALPHHRPRDLGARPAARSPISSPASAPAAPSWAWGASCATRRPAVRLVSVEPDSPFHGLEGMKHMASALVPPIYDPGLADEAREMPTETRLRDGAPPGARARAARRRLRRRQRRGGPGGGRSGAARRRRDRRDRALRRRRQVPIRALLGGGARDEPDRPAAPRGPPPSRCRAGGPCAGPALAVSATDMDAIGRHAERTYPEECCGFLLGRGAATATTRVERVAAGRQRAPGQPPQPLRDEP